MVAAKLTGAFLGMLSVAEWLIAVGDVPYVNVVLNFLSLAGLVIALIYLPRAFKAKGMEAELREKDRIIETRTELAATMTEKVALLAEKAAELGGLLDHSRADAAAWQARYEEQAQYTAGPALTAITRLLEHTNKEAERRHKEILLALRALRTLGSASPVIDDD